MSLSSRTCVFACVVVAFALLVPYRSVDGFGTAAAGIGNGIPTDSPRPSVPKRITIIPDSRTSPNDPSLWPQNLQMKLEEEKIEVTAVSIPDPYVFNNKRYERFWLSEMDATYNGLNLSAETLVVAHGTSADALMRYIEIREVWGAVLVCPSGEIYYAGERHGRAYLWSRMKKTCPWIAMVHGKGDPLMGDAEARAIKDALGIPSTLYREINGGESRFRHHTGPFPAVEELVAYALNPPVQAPIEDT